MKPQSARSDRPACSRFISHYVQMKRLSHYFTGVNYGTLYPTTFR